MIKGVNRQIIEISKTGNIYYEKAILVVRPQYRDAQQALLEKQAQKMLKEMKAPSAIRKRSMFIYYALRVLIPAGVGALVTAGVFQLL